MAETASDEFITRIKQATGLVHLDGKIFWSQQQLLEKINDPLAVRLVKLIKATDTDKRDWRKILLMLEKSENPASSAQKAPDKALQSA